MVMNFWVTYKKEISSPGKRQLGSQEEMLIIYFSASVAVDVYCSLLVAFCFQLLIFALVNQSLHLSAIPV
jgi:hypothetical protein